MAVAVVDVDVDVVVVVVVVVAAVVVAAAAVASGTNCLQKSRGRHHLDSHPLGHHQLSATRTIAVPISHYP